MSPKLELVVGCIVFVVPDLRESGFRNGLRAIHPGEFLRELLEDLGTSQADFARAIGVSAMRVSHFVNGTRPVTAEFPLFFGRAFGQSPSQKAEIVSGAVTAHGTEMQIAFRTIVTAISGGT